ncbi:nicotinate-nucleotide adenylyltransferase [Planktothrix mougeotii]|uniref:Probable nicotinate-nucleotide adenylyltransferase n=1 Tax=Planktothrix mougeotii LEGE 06226 TaxID=1828728 RepID=A0ABR9UGU8_9CYAN|nr:nicotinate-nucleotide adenylyltransferase [Planktothrix mougeotii]MBE9145688.1 nicotinate-nucleotide adenylyltransferase [Planktothrix mougeotii LEGE 06226]
MTQIALFGTSADPPTAGHQAILHWLSQRFDQVVVWASDNPFKTHQTPLEHRMKMLSLLIEEINPPNPNIAVYPELSSRRTLETLERAKQYWSEAEYTLVIGSDLVQQIPQWYQIETLLKQVKLLIVPRPGYGVEATDLEKLKQLGGQVKIADIKGLPVSSSHYRQTGNIEVLPPPVQAYIDQEQLYESTVKH